ncbi:MAG: MmcQ/YjbR family DNA-binding protein [Lachnospiraceae bacterium]|nr:MmcQ/YjbR family DNA-binding protein [Lachnospiraceae bacterium]
MRKKLYDYAKKKYKAKPEYLWKKFPDYAILRHIDNNKWFALIMDVPKEKFGLGGDERIDVVNVKLSDPLLIDMLLQKEGYFRGYHTGRGNWISILLDGSVPFEEICKLIDESFMATASKKNKLRPPKEWLIPANPAYYDIVHAFDDKKEIDWKQGNGIKTGDTIYMYVGSPISAIMYKCTVIKTDIPYDYKDENLTIKALMRIKLKKRYKPDKFTFDVLKSEYGIYAVRGPRGIPGSLSNALK